MRSGASRASKGSVLEAATLIHCSSTCGKWEEDRSTGSLAPCRQTRATESWMMTTVDAVMLVLGALQEVRLEVCCGVGRRSCCDLRSGAVALEVNCAVT